MGIIGAIVRTLRLEQVALAAGPVFEKELRVASRRRRNYLLRFAYAAGLTLFVYVIWAGVTGFRSSVPAYNAFWMSQVARLVTADILDFQFFVLPLLAAVLLSGSVGEEIRQRTLAVLMVTPVGGFRLVLGKLLSGTLQVSLLLAISLPLMMVVRVMGGVPWAAVAAGLAVTLTTCVCAGSVSLLVSTFSRRVYVALPMTLFLLAAALALHAIIVDGLRPYHWGEALADSPVKTLLEQAGPLAAFEISTGSLRWSGSPLSAGEACWVGYYCGVILLLSAGCLAWCGRRVRKIGLRLAMGELRPSTGWERIMRARLWRRRAESAPIRPIAGSPILWRERRVHFGPGRLAAIVVGTAIAGGVVAVDAVALAWADGDTTIWMFIGIAIMLLVLAVIVTMIQAAPGLATEKEAGTLPILLSTPLSRDSIVYGKAVGALARAFPVWGLLLGHLAAFVVFGRVHPVVLLHLVPLVAGILLFIAGAGLFFSALARKATSATALGLGLVLVWLLGPPLLAALLTTNTRYRSDPQTVLVCTYPVMQAFVITYGAANIGDARPYEWRRQTLKYNWGRTLGETGWPAASVIAASSAALHAVGGLVLLTLAARLLAGERHLLGRWLTQRDYFLARGTHGTR